MHSTRRQALQLVSAALITGAALCFSPGCVSHQATAPEAPDLIPASFSTTGQAQLPAQWWQHLQDPALNQLIETALADSPSLAAVWDRLAQAQAIAQREGAQQQPELDLTAGVGTERRRTGSGNNAGTRNAESYSLGLRASYEVDLWGGVKSTVQAATLDAQASLAQVQASAITLSASVATAWYQLIEARGQIGLIESQIQINQQVLELLELRFRQGQSQLVDVLRQRQLLQARQGQLELARLDEAVLVHQLNVLIGRPTTTPINTTQNALANPPALPSTGLPLELLQRRPDLLQALYAVQAQDHRLAAAIADKYPQLTLSADVAFTSDKLRDLLDNWVATLAAELAQPLLDGGQREAEVDRFRASVSEQINNYRSAILTATQDVEDALAQESQQERYLASLRQQFELSELVLERTRDGYLNRGLNYLDVLDALDSNQSLQQDILTAQRQHLEYRIALCRALAGAPPLERPEPRTLDNHQDKEVPEDE